MNSFLMIFLINSLIMIDFSVTIIIKDKLYPINLISYWNI